MKLYELTEAVDKLHDDESIDEQTLKDTLESIEGDISDKGVSIVKLSNAWESDIDAIDAEIKRLQLRKKSLKSRSDSLRDYLKYNMQRSGISKIECSLFTITLKKGRSVVSIADESLIPDDYVNVKTTVSPDKVAILKALKEGEEIEGAELSEGQPSLVIK
ncbi:MAG: siphovirus Gp157 family protein [Vibrio splendidus]